MTDAVIATAMFGEKDRPPSRERRVSRDRERTHSRVVGAAPPPRSSAARESHLCGRTMPEAEDPDDRYVPRLPEQTGELDLAYALMK